MFVYTALRVRVPQSVTRESERGGGCELGSWAMTAVTTLCYVAPFRAYGNDPPAVCPECQSSRAKCEAGRRKQDGLGCRAPQCCAFAFKGAQLPS